MASPRHRKQRDTRSVDSLSLCQRGWSSIKTENETWALQWVSVLADITLNEKLYRVCIFEHKPPGCMLLWNGHTLFHWRLYKQVHWMWRENWSGQSRVTNMKHLKYNKQLITTYSWYIYIEMYIINEECTIFCAKYCYIKLLLLQYKYMLKILSSYLT